MLRTTRGPTSQSSRNSRRIVTVRDYSKRAATKNLVGAAGFEPATTSTQSSCTTGLCDAPKIRSRSRAHHAATQANARAPSEEPLPASPEAAAEACKALRP